MIQVTERTKNILTMNRFMLPCQPKLNFENFSIQNTMHYTHFLREFVTNKWTSCRSSRRSIAPKYPILLSVNFGEAINFKHSSCKNKQETQLITNEKKKPSD